MTLALFYETVEAIVDSHEHTIDNCELFKFDVMKAILVHCYSKVMGLFKRPRTCSIKDLAELLNVPTKSSGVIIDIFKKRMFWVRFFVITANYQLVCKFGSNN